MTIMTVTTLAQPAAATSDRLIVPPAREVVSFDEMKLQSRIDNDAEAALVTVYVRAAAEYVQQMTGRALITQTRRAVYSRFGAGGFALPYVPVQSIKSITYLGADAVTVTVDPTVYRADVGADPALVGLATGGLWPTDAWSGVSVDYIAGYGAMPHEVPEPLRQAVRLLAGHWFENREEAADRSMTRIAFGLDALIAAYRRTWIA